jgi:hypothetical protein
VTAGLSAQEAQQEAAAAAYQAGVNSGLSAQEARQAAEAAAKAAAADVALERIVQEGANYRQQVELVLQETLAMAELATEEKSAIANQMSDMGERFMLELANIQRDPNVAESAKTAAIKTLQDAYMANLESLGAIYGVEIDWTPLIFPDEPAETE